MRQTAERGLFKTEGNIMSWISENISTILVLAALSLAAALIIRSLVKNKKQGKSSCGCGCSTCAMSEACHGGRTEEK